MANLAGDIAMVTGGATGIGAAIAEGLADMGASVACCYHTSRAAAETLALSVYLELSEREREYVAGLIAAFYRGHGKTDDR